MNNERTKITFETEYNYVEITVNKADMTLPDVIEELVAPVLKAAGYHETLIREYLGEP